MKKSIKLFYLFAIVAIIAINFLSISNSSTNLVTLTMLENALAECPEGTPADQDEKNEPRSCSIWCDEHVLIGERHWVFGTEIICVSGCTDCSPVDCDAEECKTTT